MIYASFCCYARFSVEILATNHKQKQNFIHAIKECKHPHAAGTASYLEMWKRWWAIVGCRRVVVPNEWVNIKTEIDAVIKLFEKHQERYAE